MRRVLLAALLAAVLPTAAVAVPGAVQTASATTVSGACTTNAGVTVVVNFGSLGGGTQVHCDTGATSSTTGLSALSSGFSTAGTHHDGPGFVCRINDKPSPSQDPCINTPPATAYWSYWYAGNGGSWTYSSKGAANRTVIVGGFEGWSFGDGGTRPTSGSPSHPVPVPQPKPSLSLGPAASTTTTGSSHSSSASSTKKPSASRTTATPSGSTTSPTSPTSTEPPAASSTAADSAGGELAAERASDGGSPWQLLGVISGIALIIAGAVVIVLRRRGAGGF